ncbi:hypothetical protein NHX12_022382 [Muraenolepis orangiensis]|uniref:Uncharacterized protein n=1 Tax=Muraenolepis orangiensis TaxID=630683 RepID=A0A9Q0EN83_9TELE|nr:hypothetical protein NHX12_022382 [Muraenolepis orangiensis]
MADGQQQWKSTSGHEARRRTCYAEQDACERPLWRTLGSGLTLCVALSLLSLGVCTAVFLRTSELQSRISSLEQQRGVSGWMSPEQVDPVWLARLDSILEEKLAARLPKTREARDVAHNCLCPPEEETWRLDDGHVIL